MSKVGHTQIEWDVVATKFNVADHPEQAHTVLV